MSEYIQLPHVLEKSDSKTIPQIVIYERIMLKRALFLQKIWSDGSVEIFFFFYIPHLVFL